MTAGASRSLQAGATILVVACLTAIGSYQKLRDLDRSDSALYAYGAFLMEQGGRLYQDIWDHKPPGVYALDAMAFRLAGGVSWPAAVAADTLATLLAVAACAAITARITPQPSSACIAAATAAFYLNLAAFHEGGGLAEIYMVACLGWAGCAFVAAGERGQVGGRFRDSLVRVPLAACLPVLLFLKHHCTGGSRQWQAEAADATAGPQGQNQVAATGSCGRYGDATRSRAWLLAISEALVGLAILCKPTALTTAAACLVTLGVEAMQRRGPGHLVRGSAAFAVGLTGPLLAAGLAFWRQGSLGEMIDASLLYNLSYVGQGATVSKLWTHHVWHNAYLLAAIVGVLGATLLRRMEPAQPAARPVAATWRVFLPVWLLFEWAGIYAGNFDNGQYLFGCVVPLSCMAGIAGAYLLRASRQAREQWAKGAAVASLVLAVALTWWPARDQWRRTAALARGETSELAAAQVRAAERILASSGPDDRIWVWGYAPQVYLRSLRQPATRFVFDGVFLNSRRVMRVEFREMLDALDRSRPTYIVDAATTGWFGAWLRGPLPRKMPGQAEAYRSELARLQAWVAEHYEPEAECGELLVYRRRSDPGQRLGHLQPAQPGPPDGPDPALGRGW